MRSTFSLRHMLVFALTLCLISVVAGAALAQDEPSAPEPVVPVFDLTGSSDEAVSEPAAVAPVVIAPAVTGLTVDGPTGVITTTDPTWIVNADGSNGVATVYLSLYDYNSTLVGSTTTQVTDLTDTESARITFNASAFQPMASSIGVPTGIELLDGFEYSWQLFVTDDDGPSDTISGEFIIDVPLVSPPLTDTQVINTTPLITWPAESGVAWYAIASYVPSDDVLAWFDYYPADDSDDYGIPRYDTGICANDQCKVRPYQSVSYTEDFSEFVDGDFTVQIWVQKLGPAPAFAVVEDWAVLTEFDVVAPDVNVDTTAGISEGRPEFSVTPKEQVVDELPVVGLLGMTTAVKPDYYYVFLIPGADVVDDFDYPNGFAAEWYYAGGVNPDGTQDLWAWDGEQDLLYNGTWTYWVQGYISQLDAYTNWTVGGEFTIDADAPLASEVVFAGAYESIGTNGALNPNPWALTSTWVACVTGTGCDSNRPLLHIAPSVGGDSGDWLNIIIYSGLEGVVYDEWFNVYDVLTSADDSDVYWYCDWFGGSGETCFLQIPDVLEDAVNFGLSDGVTYDIYIASYGPGGFSDGDFGPYDLSGEFELAGPSALANLNVDVTGDAVALTNTTGISYPLTGTFITGEPRFSWDTEDTATYFYYQINDGNDTSIDFVSGTWLFNSEVSSWAGTSTIYIDEYLPNGNYTAVFVYWNGGISDQASVPFTIANGAPAAALTDTWVVYVDENLTGTSRPIFRWDHAQNNIYYWLAVEQNGELVYVSDALRALDVCYYVFVSWEWDNVNLVWIASYDLVCELRESVNDLYVDALDGNAYTWTVYSYSPDGNFATSADVPFELDSLATGTPKPVYPFTDTTLTYTVKPTFYFEPAANASWYQVYIGDDNGPVVFDWYYISYDNRPDGLNAFYPNAIVQQGTWSIGTGPGNDPVNFTGELASFNLSSVYPGEYLLENGDYEWWMQPWGNAGYLQNSLFGWVKMADIAVDIPAPEPVEVVDPNGGTLVDLNTVWWRAAPGAQYYNIKIVDTANDEVVYEEWVEATYSNNQWYIPNFGEDAAFTNWLSLEIEDDSFLSEWGVFEIVVSGWGQGTTLIGGSEDNTYNATPPATIATFTKL